MRYATIIREGHEHYKRGQVLALSNAKFKELLRNRIIVPYIEGADSPAIKALFGIEEEE